MVIMVMMAILENLEKKTNLNELKYLLGWLPGKLKGYLLVMTKDGERSEGREGRRGDGEKLSVYRDNNDDPSDAHFVVLKVLRQKLLRITKQQTVAKKKEKNK